ncbi:hypothetical protein BX600DRAFT_452630 [Xylariales sp. PMI_506]|nr:hypothetical protein BX600DRAFT_452630 [Xylariales sp. PMI_506]
MSESLKDETNDEDDDNQFTESGDGNVDQRMAEVTEPNDSYLEEADGVTEIDGSDYNTDENMSDAIGTDDNGADVTDHDSTESHDSGSSGQGQSEKPDASPSVKNLDPHIYGFSYFDGISIPQVEADDMLQASVLFAQHYLDDIDVEFTIDESHPALEVIWRLLENKDALTRRAEGSGKRTSPV